MTDATTNKMLNCPKCQAEMSYLRFGEIEFEECGGCRGIFLDFHETNYDPLAKIQVRTQQKPRQDAKELNHVAIDCPKCKVPMDKREEHKKEGLVLDVCTSCRGIWFDEGEFATYHDLDVSKWRKASPFKLWHECSKCKITRDGNAPTKNQGAPKCPRCNDAMTFKSIRIDAKKTSPELNILLKYVLPTVVLIAIIAVFMGSLMHAMMIGLLFAVAFFPCMAIYKKIKEEC